MWNSNDIYQQEESRDILRKSLADVRAKAQVQGIVRNSPQKVYSVVKSKVAGNIKSINKSNARKSAVNQGQYEQEKEETILIGTTPQKLALQMNMSQEKIRKLGAQSKSSQKSQLSRQQQEKIIQEIRNKYSIDKIKQMSSEQLQSEIIPQIVATQKNQTSIQKEQNNELQNQYYQVENSVEGPKIYEEIHDRSQQLQSSVYSSSIQKQNYLEQSRSAQVLKKVSPSKIYQTSPSLQNIEQIVQKTKSPNRNARQSPLRNVYENQLDPEFSRALAREMYVNEVVNVVKEGGKSSVKPGQMNLFCPQGQTKGAQFAGNFDEQQSFAQSPGRLNKISMQNIQNIFRDEGGRGMIRNTDLRQKTEEVQREFDRLMNEMVARRNYGGAQPILNYPEGDPIIDSIMDRPYNERKHKSPTKRLINHKNSTWDHKKRISTGIAQGQYSQIYCISPGKTYVIEPEGGELPYELAERSPQKFYSKVLNQDIKKCVVKNRGKLIFEWTKRDMLQILMIFKEKLVSKLSEKIGLTKEEISNAFGPGTAGEDRLKEMLENQQIDLLDPKKQESLLYKLQRQAQQKNENILNQGSEMEEGSYQMDNYEGDEYQYNETENSVNIRVNSPQISKLDNIELLMKQQDLNDLEDHVMEYHRKQTLLKEQNQ